MGERGPTDATAPIRVVLVDDQPLVRAGFRALLAHEDDIDVVAEASDGGEAVAVVRRTQPDVVLMDARMPGTDGIEATRQITADPTLAGVRVVVITTFEVDEYVFDALRAGASGFLLKDVEPDELRRAVRVVAAGESLLSPRVTGRLIATFVAHPDHRPRALPALALLTEREREVMALVGTGLSNDEIAARLFISRSTAKAHVSRAMIKLQARDRAQLVVLAYQCGLV